MSTINRIGDALGAIGRAIDTAVNVVVIDGVCGTLDLLIETVADNPGKAAGMTIVTVASGGAAFAFAGTIAATLGGAGLLGAASTGTAISSLGGVAATNASLAAIGGGAIAAGGGGMAAGTAVVAASGAAAGLVTSGGVVALLED